MYYPVIHIEGEDAVRKILDDLGNRVDRRLALKALRKAARPLILSARSKVMDYSRTVGKSITINYTSRDSATIAVGPKKKMLKGGLRDPWYAHFIEFGVSGVGRFKGSGKKRYRADQPARPFMRPAYDETRIKVVDEFGRNIVEVINKHTQKVNASRSNI